MIQTLALLLAALAITGVARAEECATCHDEVRLDASVHGGFACASCHECMEVVPHPDEARAAQGGSAACGVCHEVGAALAGSIHAPLDCQNCHGSAHEIRSASDAAAPSSPL